MKFFRFKFYIILVCCSFLFSCKVGKTYKGHQMDIPEAFGNTETKPGSTADIGWSTLYSDTTLQELIDKALIHNKDILIATANIKEMIARKRINFANLFPNAGVEVLGQREYLNYGGDNPKYTPEIHGVLTFGWEVDIWGKLRWANDAGIAQYMQSVETQQALKLTIVAQVAQTYFELIALDQELEIVKQTVKARKQGVHFAKLRYEGGQTSEIPYLQSQVELARTETLVPSLENDIKIKESDLSTLLGEFPSAMPRGRNLDSQQIQDSLPVDLPSSLLQRRPDIRLAEQKLIEANAEVGVALTSMFPSINLAGKLGDENSELADLLKSPTWFVSGLLTGPLFNMSKNMANHKASQAVYEQIAYDYEKTVIQAFKEVDNAIITFEKAKEVRKTRENLYKAAQSYQGLAGLQYINGIISYMDVLDAQRQLFDAEIALNNAILEELSSTVSLYKALGGGLIK